MDDPTPRGSLRPPFRGDHLALAGLVAAFFAYAILLSLLTQAGLIGTPPGPAPDQAAAVASSPRLLVWLNVISVTLTLAAFFWSYFKDWRWLRAEEVDIAFLLENPEGQADPSRVLHAGYSSDTQRRVETLLDDRVIRVLVRPQASGEAIQVRESELRAVAASRSVSIGSFARYSSGLLLLLTVLGTFVGVKNALGPLASALTDPNAIGGAQLAGALDSVAAAFGANLAALVGAIVIGLASYALAAGRQNMLARLEQASSLYVYPKAKKVASTDALMQAVQKLDAASTNIGVVAAHIIEFGDTITDLSSTVSDSLAQTRSTLKTLLEQQSVQVAEQSRKAVDKLEHQITDVVTSVQHATTLYGTLVASFEAEGRAATAAQRDLTLAVEELRETRETFGRYADSLSQTLTERVNRLEVSSNRQVELAERIVAAYERMNADSTERLPKLDALLTAVTDNETLRQSTARAVEEKVAGAMTHRLETPFRDLMSGLEKLSGAVDRLDGRLNGAGRTPPPSSAESPADLVSTLWRLARALDGLEKRASETVWQTLMRKTGGSRRLLRWPGRR